MKSRFGLPYDEEDQARRNMEGVTENVVLALMAHPDDAELLCGGTLALLAKHGWGVHVDPATPGDCGSTSLKPEAIAAIRRQEARSAVAILGGQFHCLERRDLQVRYDGDTLVAACGLLRGGGPRPATTPPPRGAPPPPRHHPQPERLHAGPRADLPGGAGRRLQRAHPKRAGIARVPSAHSGKPAWSAGSATDRS